MVTIYIQRLSLTYFRNYQEQEVDLAGGINVLHGNNAQGKTNFLEACYLIGTTRAFRTRFDRELIGWRAATEPLPYARIIALTQQTSGATELEVVIQANSTRPNLKTNQDQESVSSPPSEIFKDFSFQRSYRINKTRRRTADMIGELRVVLFAPQDVELAKGAPTQRRRYIDLSISQINKQYLQTLQEYNRIITQRNSLLRRIRDQQANAAQLGFWNKGLVELGSRVLFTRLEMLSELNSIIKHTHANLINEAKTLFVDYVPTLEIQDEKPPALVESFQRALEVNQSREIAAGQTLIGPHRDDIRFLLDGTDIGIFGSQGENRTVAVALKLAEAEYMRSVSGEAPVLLLDDVLSELDLNRQARLLQVISEYDQAILTTTDLSQIPSDVARRTFLYQVTNGVVTEQNGNFPSQN
ncbi:DNA replication and repair protein RecF [Dehalococcoidia bacterium]|nr:DNA replication and repair protein RecF [Dehalococcoidia bacterium]